MTYVGITVLWTVVGCLVGLGVGLGFGWGVALDQERARPHPTHIVYYTVKPVADAPGSVRLEWDGPPCVVVVPKNSNLSFTV